MTAATKIDWASLSGVVLDGGYELTDVLDGRDEAAKLRVRILGSGGRTGTAYFLHLGQTEADDQQDIWQTLRDAPHPNLIRPSLVGRRDVGGFDTVFMVLPDADERLATVVPERPLEWEEAAEVLHSCEKGLAHLHAHGLIHGCVSPETVEAVGYTVLLNTESVRRLGKKLRVEWNKPHYLAPESKGANLTTAADVWCLGATLVEVLSQHPYGSPGAELEKGLPLGAVILRCVDKNPVTRCTLKEAPAFESGHTLVVEPVSAASAPIAEPPPPAPPAAPIIPEAKTTTTAPPAPPYTQPVRPTVIDDRSARSGGASRIPHPLTPKASPAKQVTKEDMALVPVGKRHRKVQKRQPIDARIRTLDEPIGDTSAEEAHAPFLMPAVGARTLAVGNRPKLIRNVIAAVGLALLFFAAIRFIIIPKLESTDAPVTSRVSAQTPIDIEPSTVANGANPNFTPPANAANPTAPSAAGSSVTPPAAVAPQPAATATAPAPVPVEKPHYFRVVLSSYADRVDAVHELETLADRHPELLLRIAPSKDDPHEQKYMVVVGGVMTRGEAEPLRERLLAKGLKSAHLVEYFR